MPASILPTLRDATFEGRIGIARSDISPPVGIFARNWGAAKHDCATSIHRPLTMTALALAPLDRGEPDGGEPLVFVDADLVAWRSSRVLNAFFDKVCEQLSLEPANLILGLSHTHSSPPLMDLNDPLAQGAEMQAWMPQVLETTVRTIRSAFDSQFVGLLQWHEGKCNLASSRDLPDPDGARQRMVCGFNPAGATDDTLFLGRITDSKGATRGTITNYACHPTTLAWDNTAISPDYVGAMRETIEHATGAPAMFMLGACGELAPRYQYVGDPSIADRHGKQLGHAALAAFYDMEPPGMQLTYAGVVESGAPLAVWRHEPIEASHDISALQMMVTLPLKNWPTASELERQRQLSNDRAIEERLRRQRSVRLNVGDESTFDLPIHVWRVGDAVIVGTCCEAYSMLQQELRRRFPQNVILCLNLINGSVAYLPPADLYDVDVYPVWQTPFERGCLERTLEKMTEAIGDVLTHQ